MRATIERRIAALEMRKDTGGRTVHLIKATDLADRDRQMAELLASGNCRTARQLPFDHRLARPSLRSRMNGRHCIHRTAHCTEQGYGAAAAG
jgi:hypothetical protein